MAGDDRLGTGRRRADATRNVALLLAAARDVIAESGSELVLDEVARRAGVGNATLYRHFPTRADLLVAVYQEEVADLGDRATVLSQAAAPMDALLSWLDAFVVHVATKRSLALAATEDPTARRSDLFDQWHAAIHSAAAPLLQQAQDAGSVRSDVTLGDVLALANGAALAGRDVEHARRLVGVACRGIGTHAVE